MTVHETVDRPFSIKLQWQRNTCVL